MGKLQELTHEMDEHRWNILGLCEMRWKNIGETRTEEGHNVFFSKKRGQTQARRRLSCSQGHRERSYGVPSVSSRLITIRPRAVPFNISVVQAYALTSDHDDNKVEEFYDQLQNVID